MVDKTVVKGFSSSCKVLTYSGLKYVDELSEDDMLYTYDINGGYSEYTEIGTKKIVQDGFYNLTDMRLTATNSIIMSPTNPLVVTTKEGLRVSNSMSIVKDAKLLICISDDIKELNLNVDMYVSGVLSGALEVLIDSDIRLKCSDNRLMGQSLKDKKVRFSIDTDGYIHLLEPITELCVGSLMGGLYSKGITARLSYLLGVLECLTVGVIDNDRLRLKHNSNVFLTELSYLMLTVGVLPMVICKDIDNYILDYVVPVNIRKLYNSKIYEGVGDSLDILSESRIVKREGGGTRGIRLYFRRLEQNPLKLSYDYYGYIVEIGVTKSKYCLMSTMGVPVML